MHASCTADSVAPRIAIMNVPLMVIHTRREGCPPSRFGRWQIFGGSTCIFSLLMIFLVVRWTQNLCKLLDDAQRLHVCTDRSVRNVVPKRRQGSNV